MGVAATIEGLNLRRGYQLDAAALVMLGLFAIVIPVAILGYDVATAAGVESVTSGESTSAQAGGGAAITAVAVIEASLLLGVIVLYNWFPGWFRPAVKQTVRVAFWGLLAVAGSQVAGGIGFAAVIAAYFAVQVTDQLGIYWLVNGVVGLGIASYGAVALAVLTSPIVLGVGLVGLTAYDHVFANERPWMGQLARGAIAWKLPMMIVLPNRPRFQWSLLADNDVENDFLLFGLGLGDLVIPSAFVASVYHSVGTVAAAGVVAGIGLACFRLSWASKRRKSMAGLPALAAGCFAGFVIAYPLALLGGMV